jgi:hypothetical protein
MTSIDQHNRAGENISKYTLTLSSQMGNTNLVLIAKIAETTKGIATAHLKTIPGGFLNSS